MNVKNEIGHIVWRRITMRYILALAVVAFLTVIGQFLIYILLDRHMSDADVINIAGRQRMLSQKIVKSSLAAVHAEDEENQSKYLSELEDAVLLWEEAGMGLRFGDVRKGLPGKNSEVIEASFAEIDSSFQVMREAARILLSEPGADLQKEALDMLIAHEAGFLEGMNRIVFQYADESRRRVEQMHAIEWVLMVVTLCTLVLIGLVMFRPMASKVKEAIDVTEANVQLLRENKDLEKEYLRAQHAIEAKNVFLANMSHELRTPLNGVIGMADLLVDEGLTNEQKEYAEIIQASSENLLVIINDILDFSKIEGGKLVLEKRTFDVHKLISEVVLNASVISRGKPLNIKSMIDESTPQYIMGDSTRVSQVMMNILSNAVKFTEEGEVLVSVSATQGDYNTIQMQFSVRDTGIGIPAERLNNIFESFEQVDASTTRKYGGTGLGLAISKRLCEMMGGCIWVESTLGEGSVFYFTVEGELPREHAL